MDVPRRRADLDVVGTGAVDCRVSCRSAISLEASYTSKRVETDFSDAGTVAVSIEGMGVRIGFLVEVFSCNVST